MDMSITVERFNEIFKEINSEWDGDNAYQGLQIIAKYIDPKWTSIITGAGHDELYSVSITKLIESGITEDDVMALAKLNWTNNEDDDYLSCFV